jgi:hypothetical protein
VRPLREAGAVGAELAKPAAQDTRRAVRLDEDVRERFCWN